MNLQTFTPATWQNPHNKLLDKWQLGDITREDLLEWAMWLDTFNENLPIEQSELIALIFDETDDFLFIKQAKNLLLSLCQQLNFALPSYDFADSRYGIAMTDNFYQRLLSFVDDKQLFYIANLDHGYDADNHYYALKKVIFEQNGKFDYQKQKTWFPHEVVSLGHWHCNKNFEIAYVLCNCLLARNILMDNNIFDDFSDFEIDDNLNFPLTDIIYHHIDYAKRLQFAHANLPSFYHWKNL